MSNQDIIARLAPEHLNSFERGLLERLMNAAREDHDGQIPNWSLGVNKACSAFMGYFNQQAEEKGGERIGWPGTIWMEAAVLAALREFGIDHRVSRSGVTIGALNYHDDAGAK